MDEEKGYDVDLGAEEAEEEEEGEDEVSDTSGAEDTTVLGEGEESDDLAD